MLRVRTTISNEGAVGLGLSTHYFIDDDTQTGATNANAAVGAFWTSLQSVLWISVVLSTLGTVDVMDTTGNITGQFPVTPQNIVGTANALPLPQANQGVLALSTGAFVGGRRIRGRLFIPRPTITHLLNGAPTAAYLTAVNGAASTLIGAASANWAVWSRKNAIAAAVQSATTRSFFGSVRSRRDA